MASCVLRRFIGNIRLYRTRICYTSSRTLLSSSYPCNDAWKERLQSPVLQQVNISDFALKLHDKFDKEGLASAIDIDTLANKLETLDHMQLDFTLNLFHKFRHCNECLKVKDSTHHALLRALLKFGETERLLQMLKEKINYGIFLDYYSANILLDHFIENKMYQEAAQIAYEQMLQEDFAHPITRMLSWYACHLHLKHPVPPPVVEEVEVEEKTEEEEETLIPVKFISNPWYDDHFDIPKDSMFLGKTLTMVTKQSDDILARSYELIGWGLYEKFDCGLELMKEWLTTDQLDVSKEAVDIFKRTLDGIETKEAAEQKEPGTITLQDLYPYLTEELKMQNVADLQELLQKLEAMGKIKEVNLEAQLIEQTKTVISKVEDTDIKDQKLLYVQWQEERHQLLEEQLNQYRVKQQKLNLAKRLKDLQEKEEKMRYFENYSQISIARSKRSRQKPIEEVEEDELFVSAPTERKGPF